MKQSYRHGEIALVKVTKLPDGLKPSNLKVLMTGSHGNSHSFDNGILYLYQEDEYVFGYLEAKNTTLLHNDHGKGEGLKRAKINDGYYQLRKQHEHTPSGLSPVID